MAVTATITASTLGFAATVAGVTVLVDVLVVVIPLVGLVSCSAYSSWTIAFYIRKIRVVRSIVLVRVGFVRVVIRHVVSI